MTSPIGLNVGNARFRHSMPTATGNSTTKSEPERERNSAVSPTVQIGLVASEKVKGHDPTVRRVRVNFSIALTKTMTIN